MTLFPLPATAVQAGFKAPHERGLFLACHMTTASPHKHGDDCHASAAASALELPVFTSVATDMGAVSPGRAGAVEL